MRNGALYGDIAAPQADDRRLPGLLEVRSVGLRFGGILALDDLSFTVAEGEICSLIGPNGAGKTSLFNCISRLYVPDAGTIRMCGVDLLALSGPGVARLGIMRTFQNLALWPGLTVLENVMVGAYSIGRGGFARSLWRPGSKKANREEAVAAWQLLERFGLDQLAFTPCHGLPYGTLKRIELCRTLASQPRLLMLDEPATGLTHSEVDDLASLIRALRDEQALTVLLVEHHMGMVMSISDHVVVLDFGRKIADGSPSEIRNDPAVIGAYLGSSA